MHHPDVFWVFSWNRAAISLFDYFLNPASTIYHVQDLSDL